MKHQRREGIGQRREDIGQKKQDKQPGSKGRRWIDESIGRRGQKAAKKKYRG